jgi:hypothetical protein
MATLMKLYRDLLCFVLFMLLSSNRSTLQAAPINMQDGQLSVQLLSENGAIAAVNFQGNEFFRIGNPVAYVANYGVQDYFNLASFAVNDTYGNIGFSTISQPNYTFQSDWQFLTLHLRTTRSYQLLPGLNTLRITTQVENLGDTLGLMLFETYDPDQGVNHGLGNATYNKVNALPEAIWAHARINGGPTQQQTVIAGSTDLRTTVTAGGFFSLFDGQDVNDFFDFPYDGADALADEGLHIGMRTIFTPNQTTSWHYDLSFGNTLTEAENSFFQANNIVIPEPSSLVGLLIVTGLGWHVYRRRAKQVTL